MTLRELRRELTKYSDNKKAKVLQRFFKTGPGQYAEGDVFMGVRVPYIRAAARKFKDISLKETAELLKSAVHEERLAALLILIAKFSKADGFGQRRIYELYLKSTRYINNWDLVDLSAEHIVGRYLVDKSKKPIYDLAKSKVLWERRIAILATFHYIKKNMFGETLKIAEQLVADEEDLIHKAVGWMLREVGKRDLDAEEDFLRRHYKKMPRTMLRYAIERFEESRRQAYLKGTV